MWTEQESVEEGEFRRPLEKVYSANNGAQGCAKDRGSKWEQMGSLCTGGFPLQGLLLPPPFWPGDRNAKSFPMEKLTGAGWRVRGCAARERGP